MADSASEKKEQKPGAITLFNFVDFDEGIHLEPGALKLGNRKYSFADVEHVRNTFYLMNLDIEVVYNKRLKEFQKKIEELSQYDFSKYASYHLIYMSHGNKNNVVYCKDGQFDVIAESNKVFKNQSLTDKPLYLIIEACKGLYDVNNSFDDDRTPTIKNQAMSWCLFSSAEAFVSKIGPDGSSFIIHLCKVIKEKWSKDTYANIIDDFRKTYSSIEQTPYFKSFTDKYAKFSYGQFIKNRLA